MSQDSDSDDDLIDYSLVNHYKSYWVCNKHKMVVCTPGFAFYHYSYRTKFCDEELDSLYIVCAYHDCEFNSVGYVAYDENEEVVFKTIVSQRIRFGPELVQAPTVTPPPPLMTCLGFK